VATYSERTIMIAGTIERYATDHPRAADTLEGIRSWWVSRERNGDSLQDVQAALDYLVERRFLSRVANADGTVIYARVEQPN
jgi:hypothetical protein